MTNTDIWSYGTGDEWSSMDVVGFKVEATDGDIGKVDDASYEAGAGYIVVDTGPWIFGRKVILPAQTIERIDLDDRVVYVDRTKEEIKNAPEFDPERGIDPTYQDELGGYYGPDYS